MDVIYLHVMNYYYNNMNIFLSISIIVFADITAGLCSADGGQASP